MSLVDPCDPVESYVRPIRSVLFIDDQFPTFAESSDTSFSETARARALWRACTERGWLCDVDNSSDWTSLERKQRLSACDLLVLDYHLVGNDSGPALSIIHDLARSEMPNLVVVYTADPELDQVLISLAASARGTSALALDIELNPEIEEMDIEWSKEDLLAFIQGNRRWMQTYKAACNTAGNPVNLPDGEALLERWIAEELGVGTHEPLLPIEGIRCSGSRWFQCGNLFVTVIGKPAVQIPEDEARVVLDGLETAISDWAPPWLACLIALSRHRVETGAFRDDVILPAPPLQRGLLQYILESADGEERKRRAREIATYLLTQRFEHAAAAMSQQMLWRAEACPDESTTDDEGISQLLHLNAFLCSEVFTRHHLRVGTVFRADATDTYWVCVTPACDMVPRDRRPSIDPWAVELDPSRPMIALRLDIRKRKEILEALKEAEYGRHLFFWDSARQADAPIAAACFNTTTGDPNPRLEQMFVSDRARVHQGKVILQRCIRDLVSGAVTLSSVECEVVCQLRAPYAERLAHVVGYHLSRIGVNFLRMGTSEAEE